MPVYEIINGACMEIKGLARIGGSTGILLPAYMLRNVGVFDWRAARVGITQEGQTITLRFLDEDQIVDGLNAAAFGEDSDAK